MLWFLLFFSLKQRALGFDVGSHLHEQFIPGINTQLAVQLTNKLPDVSALNCDIKEAPMSHSRINVSIKLCKVENVCWDLQRKRLEISHVLRAGSIIPSSNEAYFTCFNGMRENLVNAWTPRILPYPRPNNVTVAWIDDPALIIKRYLAVNTMHVLHDEFFPSLATMMQHQRLRESIESRMIVALDEVATSVHDEMLSWLGRFWSVDLLQATIRYRNGFSRNEFLDYVCFKEAYVGLDGPSTSWYHYGYEQPQGPVTSYNQSEVGKNIRAVADWVKSQLFSPKSPLPDQDTRNPSVISVVSRLSTRLILNELELKRDLEMAFPAARIQFLRQETMKVEEVMEEFSKSTVVIGMHGALLSLSAFMSAGSLLIEMFPYAIPAENYSPYRTLTALPEMKIKYRSWVNARGEAPFNIGYPERPFTSGGINHLPASYQRGILESKTVPLHVCCYSPFWLYRIFQDTHVDSGEIIDIIRKELNKDESIVG